MLKEKISPSPIKVKENPTTLNKTEIQFGPKAMFPQISFFGESTNLNTQPQANLAPSSFPNQPPSKKKKRMSWVYPYYVELEGKDKYQCIECKKKILSLFLIMGLTI